MSTAAALDPKLLESLGVQDQDTAAENAFARVLLIGPPKAGKTTALAATAPAPLVVNCDGASATKGAKALRRPEDGKFLVVDALNRAGLKKAIAAAGKLVAAGNVRTVILDTITLLGENLLDEISVTLQGFDKWNEYAAQLTGAVKALSKLDAHLFVVAHQTQSAKKDPEVIAEGILPAIGGSSKVRIPAMLDDWVLLECDPTQKPERAFLLGMQKNWSAGGRNVRRSCRIEATVPALFAELGIKP